MTLLVLNVQSSDEGGRLELQVTDTFQNRIRFMELKAAELKDRALEEG